MNLEAFEILDPGFGATFQDHGRPGWRRFGVPSGGAMDDQAANWANRLLDNAPGSPVIELLLQGAKLRARRELWLAITGADATAGVPRWRAVRVQPGAVIEFPRSLCGVWTYLAVEGGFVAPRWFGSASVCVRAGIGTALRAGDVVQAAGHKPFALPPGVAARVAPATEQRDYRQPPALRMWPAPQAGLFSRADRERFFTQPWKLSSQSDRVGYRLQGAPLESRLPQLLSEPVRVGTVQVPESGLPIVTLRDGPTVGGYPKLGVLDPADVSWLVQCQPGQSVRFRPADEAGFEL
ncbi:MAG TPA: biotin-dependent carboxyltransferase family protein [Verrucomicrobiae bacterium]|nr:biotin-dependent carboxyltransferase family protein [Verrucomicrobiae bacterium]